MDRDTLLSYINDADGIDFVSELPIDKLGGEDFPLFLFQCNLLVGGQTVPVKLFITKSFPRQLPLFFLEAYDVLGFLPHIEPKGSICFLERESIYINEEEPRVVFEASVELAIQTLLDGLTRKNWGDFREEFHVFWERNQFISDLPLISFIEITEDPKVIQIVKDRKKAMVFDLENADLQKRTHFRNGRGQTKSGIYLPLQREGDMIPPTYAQRWTGDEFADWVKPKISEAHWTALCSSILNKRVNRFEYLLLGIPRETGATIIVGVHLKPKGNTSHPLVSKNSGWALVKHRVKRLDKAAFLPRGGATVELQDKSVLLIGCGSVGSHFAIELAKAGIGNIHLVDHDRLEMENVQRFALGFEYVDSSKVSAIEKFIAANFWFTKVTAFSQSIEKFLHVKNVDLSKYDLIVSATGNPTTNLYLNKLTKHLSSPFLVGWNEPFGVGGHAILSSPGATGCYRCLFRNQYNITSFSAKEQPKPFHKKHLGCGEVFTPYSALDSLRTSELMARMTLAFLIGQDSRSQVLSWKGDKTTFENQGFKISSRYSQSQDELNNNRYSFLLEECPHCHAMI